MAVEIQDLGHLVKRLQHRHHRAADSSLIAIGTTLAQWDALRAISRCPDASAHQLATLTFQTDQSFGPLATRMIARGLIERTPGAGRAFKHSLTPAGAAMLEHGNQVINALLIKSFEPLNSKEQATLHGLLVRVLGQRLLPIE